MMLRALRSRSAVAAMACAAGATAVGFSALHQSKPAETASKKPKLVYFNIAGRAFVIRAALRHAKVEFEDVRISFPELVQSRGPSGANDKVPLGQLPVLELPNGEHICQSMPILRWAARQSDLYPKDINDALLCDEIVDSLGEVRSRIPEHKDDSERKKLREEFIQGEGAKYMDYVSRRLEGRGGPYFLGKQFTMADLVFARFVAGIQEKRYDHITLEHFDKWPAIKKHFEAVKVHPVYVNELKAEEELQKKAAKSH